MESRVKIIRVRLCLEQDRPDVPPIRFIQDMKPAVRIEASSISVGHPPGIAVFAPMEAAGYRIPTSVAPVDLGFVAHGVTSLSLI